MLTGQATTLLQGRELHVSPQIGMRVGHLLDALPCMKEKGACKLMLTAAISAAQGGSDMFWAYNVSGSRHSPEARVRRMQAVETRAAGL